MNDHTLFTQEGRWQIAGSTIDVAGNANIAVGFAVVAHTSTVWLLEEQINELQNRYQIQPLAQGAPATSFSGLNGIVGKLHGCLVFFDDLMLSTYRSEDGLYGGTEALRLVNADRYEVRGALFHKGAHVSSWFYGLQRA